MGGGADGEDPGGTPPPEDVAGIDLDPEQHSKDEPEPDPVAAHGTADAQSESIGTEDSASEDSFSTRDDEGRPLLDCPHYTRPREWRGRGVPDILLSGDHGAVARWRREQSVERTRRRRPDLLNAPRPLGEQDRPMSRQPDGGESARGEQSGDGPGDFQS